MVEVEFFFYEVEVELKTNEIWYKCFFFLTFIRNRCLHDKSLHISHLSILLSRGGYDATR